MIGNILTIVLSNISVLAIFTFIVKRIFEHQLNRNIEKFKVQLNNESFVGKKSYLEKRQIIIALYNLICDLSSGPPGSIMWGVDDEENKDLMTPEVKKRIKLISESIESRTDHEKVFKLILDKIGKLEFLLEKAPIYFTKDQNIFLDELRKDILLVYHNYATFITDKKVYQELKDNKNIDSKIELAFEKTSKELESKYRISKMKELPKIKKRFENQFKKILKVVNESL